MRAPPSPLPGRAALGAPAGCDSRRMYWQRDHEAGTAVLRELRSQVAVVQGHDLAADVEPQAHAARVAIAVCLVEPLEDAVAPVRRDPDAVVAHADLDEVRSRL